MALVTLKPHVFKSVFLESSGKAHFIFSVKSFSFYEATCHVSNGFKLTFTDARQQEILFPRNQRLMEKGTK